RLLTRFAVDALTNALAGKPLPAPPALLQPLANAASYAGRYAGPAGSFEIQAGAPLTIVAAGQSAPLELVSDDVFRTTHPSFRQYSVKLEKGGLASWGPNSYLRNGSKAQLPAPDPALAKLAGRYGNDKHRV